MPRETEITMMDHRLDICCSCARAGLVRVVLLAFALVTTAAGVESSDGQEDAVRIRRVRSKDRVSLFVENRAACDVTVTLRVLTDNGRVSRVKPETATYPAHSETEAARISPEDPGRRWKWRCRFNWVKGRMRTQHDEGVLYRLPFESGRSFRVDQGYHGKLTHEGRDEYAVDFVMRKGTSVCAARAGMVVDLRESSKTGGSSEKFRDQANYVCIAHTDGTIAEYHHLHYEGVLVELGEHVEAGQRIALSGNTGYSTGPHLHFGVYSAVNGRQRQSHAITFTTRQGKVGNPVEGKTYTAR